MRSVLGGVGHGHDVLPDRMEPAAEVFDPVAPAQALSLQLLGRRAMLAESFGPRAELLLEALRLGERLRRQALALGQALRSAPLGQNRHLELAAGLNE